MRASLYPVLREGRGLNPLLQHYAITINEISISPDLRYATVAVSSLTLAIADPASNNTTMAEIIALLEAAAAPIRAQVAHKMNMRSALTLKFIASTTQ